MKINKDMTLAHIVEKFPETVPVFQNKGMGCLSCPTAKLESLEKGAALHGLDVEELLKDLNATVDK